MLSFEMDVRGGLFYDISYHTQSAIQTHPQLSAFCFLFALFCFSVPWLCVWLCIRFLQTPQQEQIANEADDDSNALVNLE